ncbi:peptidase S41 [Streptomyces spiroverticillatus]|uniref:Peptidase S41 n=1 Tax=Streptomyces finlayi TaxID=67296 RepID=A0A918WYN2_9ACTN|nr:S41 family peptidase [Streptomyces finlayi]GHA09775.1 peptidase S41 [Streptomyces spiroverticillatus]GHC96065.1 peptidase S41 [Streptomyces finlayi]
MPGPEFGIRPRGLCRGAALTLVFAGALATVSTTGSWVYDDEPQPASAVRPAAPQATRDAVARAAAEAVADGKSGKQAAEEAVSRSGDRWGAVYDPAEYKDFEKSLDGEYTGVGLVAKRCADGSVQVERVRPGGPAAKAGLRRGDALRSIDGRDVDRRPVTEVVSLLRGDGSGAGAGTPVRIELQRGQKVWTQEVRRANLPTDAVTVEQLADGAVLIRVTSFPRGSGERVREAVRRAPAGKGVLLDLRGNEGGLVDEAVTAASAFLDGGLVATYDDRGSQRALHAERGGDTRRPVVALVDGGTMSAAELVTGALQDRGRALTVGSRTFGKGSVQKPSRLADGSVAELTVGHYRTPAGHNLDGRGITPDLVATERAQERAQTVLSGLQGGS